MHHEPPGNDHSSHGEERRGGRALPSGREISANPRSVVDRPDDQRQRGFGSAMFQDSNNFVVSGGQFIVNNVTNVATDFAESPIAVALGFRSIPLGELDLRHEIGANPRSATVNRHRAVTSTRRIYSARIYGRSGRMTASVFQGQNAKEDWQQEIGRYSGLRHPRFLQIYGLVESRGLYAVISHDEMVPLDHMLRTYSNSPVTLVYFRACLNKEVQEAIDYFYDISGEYLFDLAYGCMIRRSTGQLCIDISSSMGGEYDPPAWHLDYLPVKSVMELGPNPEATLISSLTLREFHNYIYTDPAEYWSASSVSPCQIFQLGTIACCITIPDNGIAAVAHVECPRWTDFGWFGGHHVRPNLSPIIMENGWSRFPSSYLCGFTIARTIISRDAKDVWMSQANHIFNRLNIETNYEDYYFINSVSYVYDFSEDTASIPGGYLFLCPLKDLATHLESTLQFKFPEFPAFWSLDPTGNTRLRDQEAEDLGFPALELSFRVVGHSWKGNSYTALRQFHRGKGFNPEGQDVARYLRYPLYALAVQGEADFEYADTYVSF
ncbi:hypothetical protein DFH09DRAFT_1218060 [Mycena vulgaris]|nr:hypothetical protein DFH09DRAFT_1218060 [Mycena vulgaris]